MDPAGSVDGGTIGSGLLQNDPDAPFGVAVRPDAFVAEAREAMAEADLAVLDPGEMDRAYAYAPLVGADQYERLRLEALARTDAILGEIVASLPRRRPPAGAGDDAADGTVGAARRPSPTAPASSPGASRSRSTNRDRPRDPHRRADHRARRAGAPSAPDGMIGRPLEYRDGAPDLAALEQVNEVATGRERIYYPMALTFIIVQALAYVFAVFAFTSTRSDPAPGDHPPVPGAVLRGLAAGHLPRAHRPGRHDLGDGHAPADVGAWPPSPPCSPRRRVATRWRRSR